ncbi:thrombospondin type 3 repeat-containing protein [Microbacterium sp. ARD31]|uniref:thrombospondin type 3 repeat-containing protein n=1 Tax=Microbacterium sp. ARD31 TaxID=2962576 RepID=UPI0028817D9C|nr:thrombospondin type 3 repeat-containing protein [Microbacterium sp. ARD31]MDT0182971.1 thrombospondin type 3 repeat-containing protein [Microbacterium sp. ARD31]
MHRFISAKRAAIAAAAIFALLLSSTTPALAADVHESSLPHQVLIATSEEPVPPSDACEWYGTMSREFIENTTTSFSRQVVEERTSVVSAPVDGELCGLKWAGSYTADFYSSYEGVCNTIVDTLTNNFSGAGTGSYGGIVDGPDLSGRYFPAFSTSITESMSGSVEVFGSGDCGEGAVSRSESGSVGVKSLSTICQEDAVLTDYYLTEDAQVAQGACVYTVSTSANGYTVNSTETTTWNLRRTVCDDTVDTDSGGVSDCTEFENGTNPADPSDDNDPDNDGDGIPDSTDDCPSIAGPASAGGCPDYDGDGVNDFVDNCMTVANAGQADLDGDGAGDDCDLDADGDDYADADEPGAGLDPRDPDSDGDTVLDGRDACPLLAGDATTGCPSNFSCDSVEKSWELFDPTYTARVVVALSPDAHLYTFGPSFIACWNGQMADFDVVTWEAATDPGLDTAVLDLFGFEVGYEAESIDVQAGTPASPAHAYASAVFTIDFDPMVLFDKLGVKGQIENKATKALKNKIEKVLVRYGYGSPEFDAELLEWSSEVSWKFISATEKLASKLRKAGVPDGLAGAIEERAVNEIGSLMREFREFVGTFASTSGMYDQGADVIAERLVSELFGKLQPTLSFEMWEPKYEFVLYANGHIDTLDHTEFVNPLLTIELQE